MAFEDTSIPPKPLVCTICCFCGPVGHLPGSLLWLGQSITQARFFAIDVLGQLALLLELLLSGHDSNFNPGLVATALLLWILPFSTGSAGTFH